MLGGNLGSFLYGDVSVMIKWASLGPVRLSDLGKCAIFSANSTLSFFFEKIIIVIVNEINELPKSTQFCSPTSRLLFSSSTNSLTVIMP